MKNLVILLLVLCGVCFAVEQGKSEIYFTYQNLSGDGTEAGFDLDLDNSSFYGVGYGYNLSENVNINTNLYYGQDDLDLSVGGVNAGSLDTEMLIWDVCLDYYFMTGAFTPYVTGGVGFAYVDYDIDDSTEFMYTLGAGVRYDFNESWFMKAAYTYTNIDVDFDLQDLDGFSVAVGFKF